MLSSSSVKEFFLDFLTSQGKGIATLRNVGNLSPNDITAYLGRLESSAVRT
jgi:hypothetical protein